MMTLHLMAVAFFVSTCSAISQVEIASEATSVNHSFSRPGDVVVKHLELDLNVDFQKKVLTGKASLFFQNKTQSNTLILDTRGLVIKRVTLGPKNRRTNFRLGEPVPSLGQPLIIDILSDTKQATVWYETTAGADALQWLGPAQTAGKKLPFLFTQSQPILARTWLPCQDNPEVRMTYRATIKVPSGMLALMSAQNPTRKSSNGVYEFYMPQPIPSYLLALAVGDIEFRTINERCGVYAEPLVVDTAAWEFAGMDSMMVAAERLYGAYRWQRYDVIVLPPSFPMGGMENPRLTFVTPTLLAGDRSLVSTIAHELAHSWSGNLVTNATWNDIWLNEGVTSYIERRITEATSGREQSEMESVLGLQDLKKDIADHPAALLRPDNLAIGLGEATTSIPYEKGYLFLRHLEETFGRNRWDRFLRNYFEAFAFQTMTTERFVAYLNEQLIKNDSTLSARANVQEWLYKPGLPSSIPTITSRTFAETEALAKTFLSDSWSEQQRTSSLTTQEAQHFLRSLPKPLKVEQIKHLDMKFRFTQSGNGEILQEWFPHAIASNYTDAYPALEKFLVRVGRLKYLRILYMALAQTPEGLAFAKRVYARARPGYHAITVARLDALLK